jgi:hypothetical protein
MIGTITAITLSAAIGGWGLWLVIRSQRTEHRSNKLYKQVRATQLKDRLLIAANTTTGARCASCGGELTALRWDAETKVNVCSDRALCRETMIHENLLNQV